MTPEMLQNLWRISPASLATTLTRGEPQPWVPAAHLQLLSRWIVDAVYGRKPRLIINMPPRHGKSELISKWTPIWFLENFPKKMVINCGYGTTFAEEWGRKVRNLAIQFQKQLQFRLASDSKSAGRWNTTAGGGMFATGIGGGITGRGADLLIVDDPIKSAKEANSLSFRDQIWTWWKDTAQSRIMPGGACIILMTRWHDDDLVGRLLAEEERGEGLGWEVLNLPAIAEDATDLMGRKPGDILWPDLTRYLGMSEIITVTTEEYLDGKKRGMSAEAWAAQYQGRPGNLAGVGNVYKSFSQSNVRPVAFDPKRPLVWSLDFNVDPMCSAVCQWHEEITPYTYLTNQKSLSISVLQELTLKESSTLEACEEFVNRTAPYKKQMQGTPIRLRIYGDRSGQSRHTVGATDYIQIRDFFRLRPEYSVTMHLSRANPAVKDRVNAVNAMLCNALGESRTWIDPSCTELRKDFEQVQWKRDSKGTSTGMVDKSDSKRTHISDAYGYFVEKEFGLKNQSGGFSGIAQ